MLGYGRAAAGVVGRARSQEITSGSDQSISGTRFDRKKVLTREKGLLPKKPRYADKGDGCAETTAKCLPGSKPAACCAAPAPQSKKARGPGNSAKYLSA
jgi:hypothetical protein